MTHALIGRWGGSLGVRLPAEIARSFGLEAGSAVEISKGPDGILVKPVPRPSDLEDLFREKSAEEWRRLYRDAVVDWGPDLGREAIDE